MKTFCKYFVYLMFILFFTVFVVCGFSVLFLFLGKEDSNYILVPRGRVLSLLIKRRFIIKCSFSFCLLEIFFFNSNHTQITVFIHMVVVSSLDAVFVKLRLLRVFCYRGFSSQGK